MKLVIKPHRPLRRALVIGGSLVAALLAVAVAVDYGHWRSIAGAMVATGDTRKLLEEALALRRENEQLRYTVSRLRRAEEINRTAQSKAREAMADLKADMSALTAELRFYRDVVGASEVDAGPRIGGVQIKALDTGGLYRYTLVMTHFDKDDRMAEGVLQLALRGERAGKQAALSYAQMVASGPESLAFRFKHFHLFEGTLRLPSDFVPRQLEVAVRDRARAGGVHAETYDWSAVLN